jgi:hypothetical protein
VAVIPSNQTSTFAQTTTRNGAAALSTRGVMRRWTGVDTTTPIRQSTGYGNNTSDPLISNTDLQLTAMKAGDAACASGGDWSAQATVTTQFDSGLSRTESINANEAGQMHFIAYYQSSTLAADDADVRAEMDASAATGNWSAVLYALATAGAWGRVKRRTIAGATETDTAGQFGMRLGLNPAVETDSAGAWGRRKAKAIAAPVETDTAGQFGMKLGLGVATEIDSAGAWGRRKARTLGAPVETDAAGAWTSTHRRAIAAASETDTAGAWGRRKARTFGVAAETDTAIRWSMKLGILAAVEIDTAGPFAHGNIRQLGNVAETDAAGTWARTKLRQFGSPAELDAAGTFGRRHLRGWLAAVEADAAGTWARRHVRVVAGALEVDVAGIWLRVKHGTWAAAVELDEAGQFLAVALAPIIVGRLVTEDAAVHRVTADGGVRRLTSAVDERTTGRVIR